MKNSFFKKSQFFLWLCGLLISVAFSQAVVAANLVSSVDRHQMGEDETLKLTITLDDASFSGSPDLAGLTANFNILNSSSGSSTTIINGTYNSKKEWRYTLLPKKTGKLLIPSFKLNNTFSDAIEIDVLPNGSTNNKNTNGNGDSSQQGDLFIEQGIDKTDAYVQERITLTLRLFSTFRMDPPDIPPPSLPDFMVEKMAQAEYQSNRNGKTYYVMEYKFALFANKNGAVTLPKQRYQIINNAPRNPFFLPGFDEPDTQTRFLSTHELTLNIKPQPGNLPAPYWLASEDVLISDNWPTQQSVDVGTPLTRTIEIKALGNLAAHIPPLPTDNISGLKSYSEQPELNNGHTNDNLLATRKENIAIVPVQPGNYVLPAIHIHWWDTKAKQFRTSTLPERTLSVKGTASAAPSSPTPTVTSQPLPQDSTAVINPSLVTNNAASTPFYMNVYLWMGAAVFFIILWLVTLVVMMSQKNKHAATATLSAGEALRQQSIKEAFKQLKTACTANDAKRARSALIRWAQLQWPNAGITTLQKAKEWIGNDRFSVLVDEMDSALYREAGVWNGKMLLDLLQSEKFGVTTEQKPAILPGLYS